MPPEVSNHAIEAFAPVLFIFCLCLVAIVYFYLRSRERQMLIERNATAEEVAAYFNKPKKNGGANVVLYRLGIVAIFFGFAIGLGIMFEKWYDMEFMIPLLIFTLSGTGLIVAHKLGVKEEQALLERLSKNKQDSTTNFTV